MTTSKLLYPIAHESRTFSCRHYTSTHSSLRWFYGRLGTAEATKEASDVAKLPGSWLLRFSTSEIGGFAFTVTGADGKVIHYRVSRDWENSAGEYILRLRIADKRYATLTELLAGARKELHLETPIAGSPLPRDIRARNPGTIMPRMTVVSLFEQCRL